MKKSNIKFRSIFTIAASLSFLFFCFACVNTSLDLSLCIYSVEKTNVGPVNSVSEVLLNTKTDNLNQATIDYTDAREIIKFNYGDDSSKLITNKLETNSKQDVILFPNNASIVTNDKIKIGYAYPMFPSDAYTITRDFSYTSFTNSKNYVVNEQTKTQQIGYYKSAELPIQLLGKQHPNYVFEVCKYDQNNNPTWIWENKQIFNLVDELFKRKSTLNVKDGIVLWFLQKNVKIKYVPKTNIEPSNSNSGKQPPSDNKEEYDKWVKEHYEKWLSAYEQSFILPEKSSVEFLDISSQPTKYCTQALGWNVDDKIKNNNEWIELSFEYSKIPFRNSVENNNPSNVPPGKMPRVATSQIGNNWANDVKLPDNLADKYNPTKYNFQEGIAFYVEIPPETKIRYNQTQETTLSQLMLNLKKVNEIKHYSNLESQLLNLKFFNNQTDAIKRYIFKVYSDENPIVYLDKNYALKLQVVDYVQTPNLDIKNFIVASANYDNQTKKYKLSFDFHPHLKDLILNLYNLSNKAKELKMGANSNINQLLRDINSIKVSYEEAYQNKTLSSNSSYSASWYVNAKNTFNLNLENIKAVEDSITIESESADTFPGYGKTTTFIPTPWMHLLAWIKDYFSKNIYIDYKLGNGSNKKLEIWNASKCAFTNEITTSNNISKITINNMYVENNSVNNLISKLNLQSNGQNCEIKNNNLIFTINPSLDNENSNGGGTSTGPSNPGGDSGSNNGSSGDSNDSNNNGSNNNNNNNGNNNNNNGNNNEDSNNNNTSPNIPPNNDNSGETNNNNDASSNPSNKNYSLSVAATVGIVVGTIIPIITIVSLVVYFVGKKKKKS